MPGPGIRVGDPPTSFIPTKAKGEIAIPITRRVQVAIIMSTFLPKRIRSDGIVCEKKKKSTLIGVAKKIVSRDQNKFVTGVDEK